MNFSGVMLILIFMGIPVLLTIANIFNLIAVKQFKPFVIDYLIFILGYIYSALLYSLVKPDSFSVHTTTAILPFQQPIINYPLVIIISVIALIGYIVLRMLHVLLPKPIIIACIIAMGTGSFICIIWIIQVLSWVLFADVLPFIISFLCLFPFNYIISSISLIRRTTNIIKLESEKQGTTD